jgi:Domain of unknown function (DUF3883)
MLESVRQPLLNEALNSPALLSDLAGLEIYIAESYDSRSFVELLQNADDARSSRFIVQRVGEILLVANDGKPFTQVDFESLCRSAASSKSRGNTIGYRGIGFKSVVGFAEKVHIISGELEATFSRELTARELPEATQVPLIRIPHPLCPNERLQFNSAIARLKQEGFTTIFVFADLIATSIESEFSVFDNTSLLFLKHIRQVELRTDVEEIVSARREIIDTRTQSIRLASSDGVSIWTTIERDGVSLAFAGNEKGIKRLEEREASVHAFLPTHETTGLAIKINGDISTDPSRTRVVLDNITAKGIETIAKLVVDLISECLESNSNLLDENMLAALIPFGDPRTIGFQRRSFKTEFLTAIQLAAKEQFINLRYRPIWLNAIDFDSLVKSASIRYVPRKFENVEGLTTFLKFLGAKEAKLEDLADGLRVTAPSLVGAAEIIAHITNRHVMKQIDIKEIDLEWKLWTVDNIPLSLTAAKETSKCLSRSSIDLITEKNVTNTSLKSFISVLTDKETGEIMLPNQIDIKPSQIAKIVTNSQPQSESKVQPLSLKRWRSAEQQVHSLLQLRGWQVEDVSRQNIGYDIEGVTPEGEAVGIEVKAIDNPGQPFTLTSNEEAVARQKGKTYYLAIVRQTNAYLEVAFIQDPINKIDLTRQCRQWAWECSSYDFVPERFPVE